MIGLPHYLNIIKSENWTNATYEERLEALQNIEKQQAIEQGRQVRTVQPIPMKTDYHCGYYDRLNPKCIYINQNHLSNRLADSGYNYEVVDTVIHEGRHAYQSDVVNRSVTHEANMAELWDRNFKKGVYYNTSNPSVDKCDYRFQPVEVDANNYSKAHLDELHTLLGSDRGYDQYVENREAYEEFVRDEAIAKYGENYESQIESQIFERYTHLYGNELKNPASSQKKEFIRQSQEQSVNSTARTDVKNEFVNQLRGEQCNSHNSAGINNDYIGINGISR